MSFYSGQRTHPQCSVSCKKNHCARWLSKVEASRGGPIKIISIEDHTGFVLISPAVSDLVVGSINASQKRLASSRRHWFGDLLKERPIRPGEKDGGDEQPRWRIYLGTAHPKGETVNVPKGLVSYGKTIKRVLSVEYRLLPPTRSSRLANSLLPRWTSPRLSGYTYLLSQGSTFSPFLATRLSEIDLANALTRYLTDAKLPSVPPPSGLILPSPWSEYRYSTIGQEDPQTRTMNIIGDLWTTRERSGYI